MTRHEPSVLLLASL